ncbi:MAG: hypothetical protein JSS27_18950 [Planctomycetes bacterium]|nr:hypothetical protein [Planctomycetota bacterium]
MRHSFPIFAALALSLVAPSSALTAPPAVAASASKPDKSTPAAPVSGEALLRQAIDRIDRTNGVSAKVRQQAELMDQRMIGSGIYLQGPAGSQLMRFELRASVGSQDASLQQVCDGEFLWTLRRTDATPLLRRVDVREVRKQFDAGAGQGGRAAPTLGLGGLPQLLRALNESFQFTHVSPTQLAGVPMWAVQGTWKQAAAAQLAPDQKDKILGGAPVDWRRVEDHLPDTAIVLLGRDDLFPYHLEYRRVAGVPAPREGGPPGRVLMMIQWYEVRTDLALDRELFRYQPGDVPVTEYTAQYLEAKRR